MPHLENASMYDNDICYNWNMIAIDNTRGNYGLISLECLCDRVFRILCSKSVQNTLVMIEAIVTLEVLRATSFSEM